MFFKKKKEEKKLDVASINELVSIGKRVVNILFILGIGCLIYLISRLLVDWGVIHGIKTLIKIMAPLFIGFIIALLDFIFMIVDNKFKFFVPEGENFGINESAKEEKAEEKTEEVKEEAPAEEAKEEKAE